VLGKEERPGVLYGERGLGSRDSVTGGESKRGGTKALRQPEHGMI